MADHTADIARIAYQEIELALPRFNLEIAWQLGERARSLSVERGYRLAIEVRRGPATVFLTAMDGTTPSSVDWLRRKANTCAWFARSTYSTGLQLAQKNQTLARHALADRDYAADGGSVPLMVKDAGIVGSLTISGLDQRADHELAIEVLCLHLGRNYAEIKLD
jgi:uncharacterized protein (UPF0303 family)